MLERRVLVDRDVKIASINRDFLRRLVVLPHVRKSDVVIGQFLLVFCQRRVDQRAFDSGAQVIAGLRD
jgi:hypothetical protein